MPKMETKGFSGFLQRGHLVKVPGLFFSQLLPQIDSLAELKVTLYCFWRLQHKEGQVVFVREREIMADRAFMSGLAKRQDDQVAALKDGLERAVARGTLLHVQFKQDGQEDDLYFVNTPRGRAAVEGIKQGKWKPESTSNSLLSVSVERPNIFILYEQNIGPLTPLIAERLRDLELTYPFEWIEEAIKIAVMSNKRRLNYFEGILKRWQAEGRDVQDSQPYDWRRFISGKYGDEIES
jgi:DnaD/phage-associated family protein